MLSAIIYGMDAAKFGMLLQLIGFGLAVVLASTFLNPEVIGTWIHRLNSKYINISLKLTRGVQRITQRNFPVENAPQNSILKSGIQSSVTLAFIASLVLGIIYSWVWLVWLAAISLSFYLVIITVYYVLTYREDLKWQGHINLRLVLTVSLRIVFTIVLATPISFLTLLLFLLYATVVILLALPAGKDVIRRVMIIIGTPLIFIGMLLQYLNYS